MLETAGGRVIGVDYDGPSLRRIRDAVNQAAVVRADAMRLPLRTASIDLAVSFETIEHVLDVRAVVCELRRVLRPGGQLVLSTPNRAFGPPARHTANPFHVQEFTADELRALLEERFSTVTLFGQRPAAHYRYVPFLMVEPHVEPSALLWKTLVRLPFGWKNGLALALHGRPFYPGETDYCFETESTAGAHALLAIAE
jgi:SAM-dependent methyltransferase